MAKEQSQVKLKYAAATVPYIPNRLGAPSWRPIRAQAAKNAASGSQSAITATVNVAPIRGRARRRRG